jgi:hypothetical protein
MVFVCFCGAGDGTQGLVYDGQCSTTELYRQPTPDGFVEDLRNMKKKRTPPLPKTRRGRNASYLVSR